MVAVIPADLVIAVDDGVAGRRLEREDDVEREDRVETVRRALFGPLALLVEQQRVTDETDVVDLQLEFLAAQLRFDGEQVRQDLRSPSKRRCFVRGAGVGLFFFFATSSWIDCWTRK